MITAGEVSRQQKGMERRGKVTFFAELEAAGAAEGRAGDPIASWLEKTTSGLCTSPFWYSPWAVEKSHIVP
eukprot:1037840-Pyramimonas_sp.AAC.1